MVRAGEAGPARRVRRKGRSFPWPDNVHEVDARDVERLELDCVVYQSHRNWLRDQFEILGPAQRRLPRIFLEHDPPRDSPTDTRHPVDDPDVLLVHVTRFNDLMWDGGRTPTTVIEHGVRVPDGARATLELERGVVVVNHLARRGRRLGADVFTRARVRVPLDLVGMGSEESGGLGEIPPVGLPAFVARYRFFFNPIRWTSLGLAVCEAMTVGVPIVGLATTEMVTVVENGVSGWLDTDVDTLAVHMRRLLASPREARALGEGARHTALERFSIDRFARDWDAALRAVTGNSGPPSRRAPVRLPGGADGHATSDTRRARAGHPARNGSGAGNGTGGTVTEHEPDQQPRTRPDERTRAAERAEAGAAHQPDRMPTPEEERAADALEPDPEAAEHAREMAERGAQQRGEGRIP